MFPDWFVEDSTSIFAAPLGNTCQTRSHSPQLQIKVEQSAFHLPPFLLVPALRMQVHPTQRLQQSARESACVLRTRGGTKEARMQTLERLVVQNTFVRGCDARRQRRTEICPQRTIPWKELLERRVHCADVPKEGCRKAGVRNREWRHLSSAFFPGWHDLISATVSPKG